jgi:hypothetical protein
MASADFCLITPIVADRRAFVSGFRIRQRFHPFQDGPQSDFHNPNERRLMQISPDRDVNYRYTTAAFLVASGDYSTCLRRASLPSPGLRYVVLTHPETGPYMLFLFPGSSPGQAKLIALHSGLPLPLVALAFGSPYASLQTFRPFLTETPLPSANTFVNLLKILTLIGFTHRGLLPHKFTPMPGVHNRLQRTALTLRC